jgi:hypothetical protein
MTELGKIIIIVIITTRDFKKKVARDFEMIPSFFLLVTQAQQLL